MKKLKHYQRMFFLNFMAILIAPFINTHLFAVDEGGGSVAEQEAQEKLLKTIETQTKSLIDEKNKGLVTTDAFELKLKELKIELEKLVPTDKSEEIKVKFENVETQLKQNKEILEKQAEVLTALKEAGTSKESKISFKNVVDNALDSDAFKKYSDGNFKGNSEEIELKGVVDITSDYTGDTNFLTSQDKRIIDLPNRKINIRDIITVLGTDLPYHAFREVYDWDKNIAMETENGELNESSFKIREKTVDVKRLGTHVIISKRMLKSLTWLKGHLAKKLPDALKFVEDFQILFGDGTGNNLDGLSRNATAFDLTYLAYVTGDFTSIAQYGTNGAADDNTLLTFTAAHTMKNGDILTLASTTGATYDGAHIITVVNDTQVLLNQDYTADGNVLANWTGDAKNAMYHNVNGAQQIDVLTASVAILNRGEYQATAAIINPIEGALIRMLKSTTEEYLKGIEVRNGILYISNVPVVETNAMPAGYFMVGDFSRAVQLLEFSSMTLEFSDDVSYKLKNEIVAIIQEEVLLPIYNGYEFIYGDFATAKSELETP